MRKLMFPIVLAAIALAITMLDAGPAQAQASRTWVSGVGNDANPCSRTAPCKTFAGAISKTAVNGEINCLDPGGFGTVTITKSITIDCHEIFASILNAGTNGIIINYDSFAVADARKTVRLRNLNFNGVDTGLNGIRIIGAASANSEVFIEDCLIDGVFGGTGRGIDDVRTGGGKLSILNTTVRNTGGTGIVVFPASGSTRIDVIMDHVHVLNSSFGISINTGPRAMITNSVFSGNVNAGVFAQSASGSTELNINNSVISNNGTGIQNAGGTTTVRISNTDIAFNGTAITGATSSFGNNRISGNTAAGTAPTPIGPISTEFGQQ